MVGLGGVSGSEAALAPAEGATPVEASGAPSHIPVIVARAVTAKGWTTIIVAALLNRPAPILVAGTSRVPTPLKDAHQAAQGSPLPAMPARDMACDCAPQPVFEAATWASFCRTWGSSEGQHGRPSSLGMETRPA